MASIKINNLLDVTKNLSFLEEVSDQNLKAIIGGYEWRGRPESTNVEDRRSLGAKLIDLLRPAP